MDDPDPQLNFLTSYTFLDSGSAIDCKLDACIGVNEEGTDDPVWVFDPSTGASLIPVSGGNPAFTVDGAVRGAAISELTEFGRWAAVVDGTEILVMEVTNATGVGTGTVTGSLDVPAGNYHSMFMDRAAQTLWVSTSSTIARYNLQAAGATTPEPVTSDFDPTDIDPGDVPGGAGGGGDLFEGVGEGLVPLIGSEFGVNLFLGVLFMGLVSFGAATTPSVLMDRKVGFNFVAAGVGAVLGLLLAWGFGFFNAAVVFALVVLSAAAAALTAWLGRR
jgi:hypothetical protein